MKKIFLYLMPCLAFLACLTSCDDEMGAKADVDNAFASTEQPAVTMTAAQVNITTISMTGAVDNIDNVLEVGFQVSETEDFASCESYPAETVAQSFAVNVSELEEMTTYYVRPYAVTRAAGTAVGAFSAVKTSELPIYTVDGTYSVQEYSLNDNDEWEADGNYDLTIEFVNGSSTDVKITNLWDAHSTVDGTYDAATQTVTIPSYQVIYNHKTYGACLLVGVNSAFSGFTDTVTLKFTPKGGKVTTSPYAVAIASGENAGRIFGICMSEMKHK